MEGEGDRLVMGRRGLVLFENILRCFALLFPRSWNIVPKWCFRLQALKFQSRWGGDQTSPCLRWMVEPVWPLNIFKPVGSTQRRCFTMFSTNPETMSHDFKLVVACCRIVVACCIFCIVVYHIGRSVSCRACFDVLIRFDSALWHTVTEFLCLAGPWIPSSLLEAGGSCLFAHDFTTKLFNLLLLVPYLLWENAGDCFTMLYDALRCVTICYWCLKVVSKVASHRPGFVALQGQIAPLPLTSVARPLLCMFVAPARSRNSWHFHTVPCLYHFIFTWSTFYVSKVVKLCKVHQIVQPRSNTHADCTLIACCSFSICLGTLGDHHKLHCFSRQ